MNTSGQRSKTRQTLSEFTSKLAAKWKLRTQPALPDQPRAHGKAELEEILRQLIAFPTISGKSEAIHNSLDYIERFLVQRGLYVNRLEYNGVEALVASTQNVKKPRVLMAGHIDVVPGPEQLFELRLKDGRYIGRGVLDMKAAIAAFMRVIDELDGKPSDYDFGLMITADEEVGGMDGTGQLVDDGYSGDIVILPDGGGDWALERAAKGVFWMTITITGRSAHSSRPWEGDSATTKLLKMISEIQALFPEQTSETNTLNLGIISGGETTNQVAASASVSIDVRTVTLEEDKRLREAIEAICKKRGAACTVEIYAAPYANNPEHPLLASFADSMGTALGRPIRFTASYGACDARYFGAKGTPCAVFYPTGGDHHGPGEWIEKAALHHLCEALRDYLEKEARL